MNILIVGYFGYKTNQLDGQTIKTRNIYKALSEHQAVDIFDTEEIKGNKNSIIELLKKSYRAKKIVFIGGKNNLTYFFPVLFLLSYLKKQNLIYVVVGGWLYDYLKVKPFIYTSMLKRIRSILVETRYLQNNLASLGLHNVSMIPNFRITPPYTLPEPSVNEDVLRLVFMARITESKGIYLLFDLIEDYMISSNQYSKSIKLDFYGPIDEKDYNKFNNLIRKYAPIATYKGILNPDEIYSQLPKYDVLLLPTFYEGEGFPGTIIDAYLCGLPVIATRWKQIPEFIQDYKTGFLIDNTLDDLRSKVKFIMQDDNLLIQLKRNAFQYSKSYSSEQGLKILENSLSE